MKKLFLPLLFLALLASSCSQPGTMVPPQNNVETVSPADQEIQVSERVQGEKSDQLFAFYPSEHKSALSVLGLDYVVQTRLTASGTEVQTIDGITPDSQHYWQFFVNGKASVVAPGDYYPVDQDYLQWKQEPITK